MFDSVPARKARALSVTLTILAVPLVLPACSPGARARAEAQSLYPLDRARAAVQLAEAGDCRGVDVLINLLDDDCDAVRMYAAVALERLCGRSFGYRYYDPPAKREQAIARWRLARQRGELHLSAGHRGAARASGVPAATDDAETVR